MQKLWSKCSDRAAQGLPEGHTLPCWPLRGEGVAGHRARLQDSDVELREVRFFAPSRPCGSCVPRHCGAHWLRLKLHR